MSRVTITISWSTYQYGNHILYKIVGKTQFIPCQSQKQVVLNCLNFKKSQLLKQNNQNRKLYNFSLQRSDEIWKNTFENCWMTLAFAILSLFKTFNNHKKIIGVTAKCKKAEWDSYFLCNCHSWHLSVAFNALFFFSFPPSIFNLM